MSQQLFFAVSYQVQYGQSVGIIGSLPEFGNWSYSNPLPLHWTEGNIWRTQINLEDTLQNPKFECKFVVFHNNPTSSQNVILEVEEGANRQYNLKNSLQFSHQQYYIEETFNLRKITFAVCSKASHTIHVQGNIPSLKQPFPLSLQQTSIQSTDSQIESCEMNNFSLFSGQLFIDMKVQVIRYHFIKNGEFSERGIGRYLIFDSLISKPMAIQYSDYQVETFREHLSYDHITEDLIVGPFINNSKDIQNLHSQGVTAIICLQTSKDMERKLVNIKEIKNACKSKEILYIHFPIRDNDPNHYIQRAPEIISIVGELYNNGHKIYIHCTSGIGRAPQTALLHFVLHRGMSLQSASQLIFQRRPISSPNHEAIIQVLMAFRTNFLSDDSSDEDENTYQQKSSIFQSIKAEKVY